MATMTCEPLSDELLERMTIFFGRPTRSVQVEVGEGIKPRQHWWVVVMYRPDEDVSQGGIGEFLTDAPEHVDDSMWMWIRLNTDAPWSDVNWDEQNLIRGQSALAKARQCFDL